MSGASPRCNSAHLLRGVSCTDPRVSLSRAQSRSTPSACLPASPSGRNVFPHCHRLLSTASCRRRPVPDTCSPLDASLFSTYIGSIYNNLSDTDGTVTHSKSGYEFLSVGTKVGWKKWPQQDPLPIDPAARSRLGVSKDGGLGEVKSRSLRMSTIDYVHQQFFPALGLAFNSKIIDPMKSL